MADKKQEKQKDITKPAVNHSVRTFAENIISAKFQPNEEIEHIFHVNAELCSALLKRAGSDLAAQNVVTFLAGGGLLLPFLCIFCGPCGLQHFFQRHRKALVSTFKGTVVVVTNRGLYRLVDVASQEEIGTNILCNVWGVSNVPSPFFSRSPSVQLMKWKDIDEMYSVRHGTYKNNIVIVKGEETKGKKKVVTEFQFYVKNAHQEVEYLEQKKKEILRQSEELPDGVKKQSSAFVAEEYV